MKQSQFDRQCEKSRTSQEPAKKQPSRREQSRGVPAKSRPKKGQAGLSTGKSRAPPKDRDLKAILVDVENRQRAMRQRELEFEEAETQISSQLDRLRRDNELLEANYQESNKARVLLLGELENTRDQQARLAERLQLKEREVEGLARLAEENRALKAHQAELTRLLAQTEEHLSSIKSSHESEPARLAAELADKKKELKRQLTAKVAAEEKAERLQHELNELRDSRGRGDSSTLKHEISKLREESSEKAAELQRQIQAISQLRAENEQLGNRLKSDEGLKNELIHLKEHMGRLEEKNRALNRQNDKLSKLHLQIERLSSEAKASEAARNQVEAQAQALQAKLDKQERIKEMLQLKADGDKTEL
jgi:hypothetical protein